MDFQLPHIVKLKMCIWTFFQGVIQAMDVLNLFFGISKKKVITAPFIYNEIYNEY